MCQGSNTAKKKKFYTSPPLDLVRPRSNRFRTGFDFQFELREVNRIRCRLYLRQTVGKHLTRSDLYKSHLWSCAPLLQEERFQLDVSRFRA